MVFARVLAAVLVLSLAACASTTVNTRLALEPTKSANLKFGDISVTPPMSSVPVDVADRLKTAVSARLGLLPQGTTPVKVQLTIHEYRVAAAGDRFMLGVIAGANRMTLRVEIVDAQGNPISDFDVVRSANAGIYGALMDEKDALIQSTADGVAEGLGAPKKN